MTAGSPCPVILKHRLPFRLGTTSYIVPEDIILNVRLLAPAMDAIELIFFESDEKVLTGEFVELEVIEARGYDLVGRKM